MTRHHEERPGRVAPPRPSELLRPKFDPETPDEHDEQERDQRLRDERPPHHEDR